MAYFTQNERLVSCSNPITKTVCFWNYLNSTFYFTIHFLKWVNNLYSFIFNDLPKSSFLLVPYLCETQYLDIKKTTTDTYKIYSPNYKVLLSQ